MVLASLFGFGPGALFLGAYRHFRTHRPPWTLVVGPAGVEFVYPSGRREIDVWSNPTLRAELIDRSILRPGRSPPTKSFGYRRSGR
jgi:hypothetical protein